MIIKSNSNVMVTGRTCPQLVLIQPSVDNNGDLNLSYTNMEPIKITHNDRKERVEKATK